MKLYTNGCSFTQGHAIEGNSTIYKANNFKYMSDVEQKVQVVLALLVLQ